jgi:hypothetical protein
VNFRTLSVNCTGDGKEYMGKNAVQVDAEINIMNILLAFTGSSYDQY